MILRFALLSLTGFIASVGIALSSNPGSAAYGLDFWREAEGLPQSRIRAITQTRDALR